VGEGWGEGAIRVYTPQAAYIVSDVLSDRSARFHTFGLDSALATRYWTAVKTGTSKDMRDNWCIGYSRKYTVGVWVGNADGEPMHDVSGVSGAAPVWLEVMDALHRRQGDVVVRSDAPAVPVGVESRQVRFEPALEPARKEYFLTGTGQDVIQANTAALNRLGKVAAVNGLQRIAYPGMGTIIALDPDIPPDSQRVLFKASSELPRSWRWQLDGKAYRDAAWFPLPGKHTLVLLDAQGQPVDQVSFEVRGAVFKKSAMR
jgi:penicillin-binding protein 1C